ncbi:MAG: hypothetical protein WDM90_08900 [Ferruginibacter sp.]
MGYSAVQGLSTSTNDQVQAFDLPPAVIYSTQPANTSVCVGSTATFTAVAVPGSPLLSYGSKVQMVVPHG